MFNFILFSCERVRRIITSVILLSQLVIFYRFSNLDVIIYTGDKDKRSELRHQIWSKRHSVQIILSTYEV